MDREFPIPVESVRLQNDWVSEPTIVHKNPSNQIVSVTSRPRGGHKEPVVQFVLTDAGKENEEVITLIYDVPTH